MTDYPITPPPKRQPSFAELLMPIPKAQTDYPITPPPKRQPSFAELLMPIPKAQTEFQPFGNHSINLPPELVREWATTNGTSYKDLSALCQNIATQAADALRAARRPKPPSLKEQALIALESLQHRTTDPNIIEPIRRALEQLDD